MCNLLLVLKVQLLVPYATFRPCAQPSQLGVFRTKQTINTKIVFAQKRECRALFSRIVSNSQDTDDNGKDPTFKLLYILTPSPERGIRSPEKFTYGPLCT